MQIAPLLKFHYILAPFTRYGPRLNSHDLMKAVAIIGMVIDHTGLYFFPDTVLFRVIGRLSFPLFCFLIGYTSTFPLRISLIMGALFLTLTFILLGAHLLPLNILWTVLACRIFLKTALRWKWLESHTLWITFCTLALWHIWASALWEYGTLAMLFAICGYTRKQEPANPATLALLFITIILYFSYQSLTYELTWPYMVLFALGIGIETVWLYHYRFLLFTLTWHHPAATLVMLLSRYSLYIYIIHVVLFKIISTHCLG